MVGIQSLLLFLFYKLTEYVGCGNNIFFCVRCTFDKAQKRNNIFFLNVKTFTSEFNFFTSHFSKMLIDQKSADFNLIKQFFDQICPNWTVLYSFGAIYNVSFYFKAVVTEFLICYAHLIFCDHLPNLDLPAFDTTTESNLLSPTRKTTSSRPKSLAISTPTKLITLEEARSKHLLNKNEDSYIEVGGGPKNLPKKYHTIIELPAGTWFLEKKNLINMKNDFRSQKTNS